MAFTLPPLAALRAFEAAARLGTFTRAAEELGMSQAAVSYQIRILEERIGTPLFVRTARKVTLTKTGEALSATATGAFADLSQAYKAARNEASAQLSITSPQTFASNWLSERLAQFQRANPDIAITLDTSPRIIDLVKEDVDLAIRIGNGRWPGLARDFLFCGAYAPMLSPQLAESIGGIRTPADLYRLPFLGHTDPWWKAWFELSETAFHPERIIPGPTFCVQFYDAVAAIAGQGVSILTCALYEAHVQDGRLVQPFPLRVSEGQDYWLTYPENRRTLPKIRRFREWLLEETRALRQGG